MKVEIRVPTYKRPNLLKRALGSLQSQTHQDWIARVFDDSPEQEGKVVCESLGDSRVLYEPNTANLGLCKNIDRCFSIEPLAGSCFLAVLEDDNYYLPECLGANIEALALSGHDIILRNPFIEQMTARDEPGVLSLNAMYDGQYTDGPLCHTLLFASFFYSVCPNNLSLFWRAQSGLNFSTLHYLADAVSQERLRTLCIDRDVTIGMRPLLVWRDNGCETLRPKSGKGVEWRVNQIKCAADERAIYTSLHRFLEAKGFGERPFNIRNKLLPGQERVFWRVGIKVPKLYRKLSARARRNLLFKRAIASLATYIIGYRPIIKLDKSLNRLEYYPAGLSESERVSRPRSCARRP